MRMCTEHTDCSLGGARGFAAVAGADDEPVARARLVVERLAQHELAALLVHLEVLPRALRVRRAVAHVVLNLPVAAYSFE